jgi:hypothetical protein
VRPIDELHQQVAAVALRAAAGHGFALGGGNALIAQGIIEDPPRTSTCSATTNTALPQLRTPCRRH